MNRNTSVKACAAAMGLLLAAGCSGGGDGDAGETAGAAPTPVAATGAAAEVQEQFERVVDTVLPSVVKIETGGGEGSGVVFDDQGHIVTNAHVVAGAREIRVTASSGGSPQKARLVGAFAPDDLAVVKVDGGSLKAAAWGDSTKLEVGQMVLAMGNPLGLAGSVTNGIVSALHRTVSTQGEGDFSGSTIADAVQTSAPINPGNSGGALVTLNGEVIGVPTAAAQDPGAGGAAPGIGFATPSDTVKRIVPQLIRSGEVSSSGRAALGVVVRTLIDPESGQGSAVAVVEVTRNSGAAKAGIEPGHLILSVNGTPTPDQTALTSVLANLDPGNTVPVEIQKQDGSKEEVKVTLGELPGGG
ncbi:S1C family serine protease [Actinomadura livida]|nr:MULTISPECIES: trypsin-like peptidase domain-containing protein [Actinomadura]MBB4773424.1 putative serine protease PepD [Actinomadura catellatispora]GGU08127.1 protease [Actinomadura livida]